MTFLEAKKIVEERGYRIAKNIEGESFRERVAREELEEAKRVAKRAGYQIINEDVDDNRVYGVDIYYNPDNDFPDFDNQEPNETVSYTFEEMANEFGTDVADDIIQLGSCDTGNGTYYKLAYVENTDTGERISANDLDFSDLYEGCCGAGSKKKKGKKKGKKSEFVPFWAKKKDGKLNEDFGDTEGTTFTSICQEYVSGGKFFAIVAQLGLQGAIEKVLADVKTAVGKGIGDKYYNTFATRLRQANSPTDALYKITNAMLAGENMDSAAGTRQSAYNRNRGVGRGRR